MEMHSGRSRRPAGYIVSTQEAQWQEPRPAGYIVSTQEAESEKEVGLKPQGLAPPTSSIENSPPEVCFNA